MSALDPKRQPPRRQPDGDPSPVRDEPGTAPHSDSFAKLYHGFGSDHRLSSNDLRVMMGLLFHSWQDVDRCDIADSKLEEYTGLGNKTVRRSLVNLEGLGLIDRRSVPYRDDNMTGRVIVLNWIADPSLIPTPPQPPSRPVNDRTHRSQVTDAVHVQYRSRATAPIGHR